MSFSGWVGNECGEVNFRSCGTKFGCVHCVVVLQVTANTPGVTRYQSKVRGGSVGVKIHGFFWSFQRSYLSDWVGNECGEVNFSDLLKSVQRKNQMRSCHVQC